VEDGSHALIGLLALTGACASSVRQTPAAVAPSRAAIAEPRRFELALFVRDATERELTLASALERELRARGVRCRVVVARSDATPSWPADEAVARASGAPFAVRVTVLARRDQGESIHVPAIGTRRSTGLAVGPTEDPAPLDFPELQPIGAHEHVDVGEDVIDHDLRLDVLASLRRLDQAEHVARWAASEGSLQRLFTAAAQNHRDPWRLVYQALANRLADQIVRALDAGAP